jgi:N-acyl-D-amino-acid deacylase
LEEEQMTSSWTRVGTAGLFLLLVTGLSEVQAQAVDLLIRQARVIDGTGSPWFVSDVAVDDGRIVALGVNQDAESSQTIDAAGRILAPGFIDVHTHAESTRQRDGIDKMPRADNFLLDGVTTIVTGNCGGSETDIRDWSSGLAGLGINVATLVGHNSIRREVMGRDDRVPTESELEQMQALVEKAMWDGAVGFSTGLLYVPGTYAKTDEVISLARVASRYGGVYASHIRQQGARLHESINEAVSVGREAGMPVQISHFKVKGRTRWGTIGEALGLVDAHRASGVDVMIDVYPYEKASTNLGVNLPRWAVAGTKSDIAARIEDPDTRTRIVAEMKAMLTDLGYDDYSFAAVAQYLPNPEWNGKTISEITVLNGKQPTVDNEIDTILEMMLEGGAEGYAYGASMIYHYMSLDDVDTILRYPNAMVASDGAVVRHGVGQPHPRSYGTNARVLADFVRERQLLRLEDAIRRMTSLPARTFKLFDRGIIRPGFIADLVLFDPASVSDRATFADPHKYSEGFDYVIVNGKLAVADGTPTDERSGEFIRGPGYRSEPPS